MVISCCIVHYIFKCTALAPHPTPAVQVCERYTNTLTALICANDWTAQSRRWLQPSFRQPAVVSCRGLGGGGGGGGATRVHGCVFAQRDQLHCWIDSKHQIVETFEACKSFWDKIKFQ